MLRNGSADAGFVHRVQFRNRAGAEVMRLSEFRSRQGLGVCPRAQFHRRSRGLFELRRITSAPPRRELFEHGDIPCDLLAMRLSTSSRFL